MKTLSEPLKSQNPKNAKPICEYNENNNNGNNTTRIIPLAYFWMPDTIFQSPDPSSLFPETGTQDQDLEPGPKPRQSASDSESQTAVQYI
uniref:HDC07382 n=1 Tax=Drosophila melanogaster TaxID=7227 RepID=Q6IG35_DROME|nr:TPA_inf: HDC07382 [Drosophila melanogaster]